MCRSIQIRETLKSTESIIYLYSFQTVKLNHSELNKWDKRVKETYTTYTVNKSDYISLLRRHISSINTFLNTRHVVARLKPFVARRLNALLSSLLRKFYHLKPERGTDYTRHNAEELNCRAGL